MEVFEMTKKEISLKRYADEREKLLTLEWKDEIVIDGEYHCPVCNFKSKTLSGLYSHLGNSDLYDMIYEKYFGEVGKCEKCGKKTKLISFVKGYHRFCSNECCADEKRQRMLSDIVIEKKMKGLKSLWADKERLNKRNKKIGSSNKIKMLEYHKNETSEHKNNRTQKQSHTMKKLIGDGKFTPNINNVYNGNVIIYDGKKYRSSWDLLFHLINPDIEYEKTLIKYVSSKDGEFHTYIVDFTDDKNKILYEIKPSGRQFDIKNIDKFKYADLWCKENGYVFIIIDEFYLKENTTMDIFLKVPKDIQRRLKCFVK